MGKIINTILAGAMALGIGGCEFTDPQYHLDGTIDGEHVRFYEGEGIFYKGVEHYLEVTREDGTKILYIDEGVIPGGEKKFSLEEVCITPVKGTTTGPKKCYSENDGIAVLKEAQEQFEDYLTKIVNKKQEEGLRLLRRE